MLLFSFLPGPPVADTPFALPAMTLRQPLHYFPRRLLFFHDDGVVPLRYAATSRRCSHRHQTTNELKMFTSFGVDICYRVPLAYRHQYMPYATSIHQHRPIDFPDVPLLSFILPFTIYYMHIAPDGILIVSL